MKTSKVIFIVLLVIQLTYGKGKENSIGIDIEQRNKVSMFDIFSKVEIIPLETNQQALIKDVSKVISWDNKYFILDYEQYKIFVFDKGGKYLAKIDNYGEGDNQYIHISDFEIDRINKNIIFLCAVDRAMHVYDMNGKFIKSYKLPEINGAYKSFKYLNKDTIVFWTFDNNNCVKFYSMAQNKIFKETFYDEDSYLTNFGRFEFTTNGFLYRPFQNTVFKISPIGIMKNAYKWDFGKLNNDYDKIDKNCDQSHKKTIIEYIKKIRNSELVNYVFDLQDNNSIYYYAQITRKNKQINIFYNRKTHKKDVFENTIEGASIQPIFWTDEYVIGYLLSFNNDYVNLLEKIIPDAILNKEDIAKKKKITKSDNPILIKYYFKK